MVFLGPSGCGKSTLLRMIAGLESVDSGEIRIGGRRVDQLPPGERRVAMVFQHYALYPHMTVRDNMSFGLRNVGISADEITKRVAQAASMLEIEHLLERKPGQISGGQKQRVAIGRAIVKEPQLFLFDEPLSNLDAALRVRTRLEIAQLHQRVESAIIFVTHDQVEAMTLAHRIVVMNNQRIEQIGTPMEIYSRPATAFVATFVGSPAMNFSAAEVRSARAGHATVQLGDGSVIDTHVEAASLPAGKPLRLGIRAENIEVCAPGDGSAIGSAKFVERLGDRTLIYTDLGGAGTFVAEDIGMSRVAIGDRIGLRFDGSAAHLFDDERGYHAAPAGAA
jgi:multiple sugar transport system ATP-binding protein